MGSPEERAKQCGVVHGSLLDEMKLFKELNDHSTSIRKPMNSELWYACAGPLVNLPQVGSLAYYFPQGHSEQVAVSAKRSATSQIPNYPNLSPQLLCQVHNVTLHADKDTDEIYAQISLQPVTSDRDVFSIPDFGLKANKHPVEFFCKTLTASDTSTHGGFSVPRRAAEKLFPPLDYTMQPPTQELVVKDLHDNTWTFRHIYRGQPKRHLLTTGWSLFVGSKRLKAGDSVLFIRDEKSQLMVGVRRANRQQTSLPSSVLSADSMHIGVLAAAAHAAANRSPFTVFYNPRACPSEFVIPLIKYRKAVYGTQISVGMRFGMMFETEESGKRRYMGTIVGISDLDPIRWSGSKWRNLQVEWDEPVCTDKHCRVSPWEIETPESLFIFPSLTSGFKRPLHSGFLGDSGWGNLVKRQLCWMPEGGDQLMKPQVLCSSIPESTNMATTVVEKEQANEECGALMNEWMCRASPFLSSNSAANQDHWDNIKLGEFDPLSNVWSDENALNSVIAAQIMGTNQDLQSQITAVSLPDSSGGTSCSNVDLYAGNRQMIPRVRTYTKVQKAGSVGRSIDVSSFKNYEELCGAIECMFGLGGLLNNPRGSGWKLVYVDYENDVLLIGDDPWEEFVGCVRCIRILSPTEVQQMSEEGMKLLNNANINMQFVE